MGKRDTTAVTCGIWMRVRTGSYFFSAGGGRCSLTDMAWVLVAWWLWRGGCVAWVVEEEATRYYSLWGGGVPPLGLGAVL